LRLGSDNLLSIMPELIGGKRIGIITNHSALMSDGRHVLDALLSKSGVEVKALFGPEHGILGVAPDRRGVKDSLEEKSGIPVFSLFGKTTKPTARMLKGLDLLLFDIQDVGVRFYTYTTTLALTMEAAAAHGIPYVVLDRPNPIGGRRVEGPILHPSLKSFVGWLPLPIVHGMTIGELAQMINGEGWLRNGSRADLKVVKMVGWRRMHYFDDTSLQWIKPSPSIRTVQTAVVYPGTCFIEGTNVSEGRGTDHPFEYLGAPWINGKKLASWLNACRLPGVMFEPIVFTPKSTRSVTTDSKYEGERCGGIKLHVTDRGGFSPVRTGVFILSALQKLYPRQFLMRPRRLDELIGTREVRKALLKGTDENLIVSSFASAEKEHRSKRAKYLIYR